MVRCDKGQRHPEEQCGRLKQDTVVGRPSVARSDLSSQKGQTVIITRGAPGILRYRIRCCKNITRTRYVSMNILFPLSKFRLEEIRRVSFDDCSKALKSCTCSGYIFIHCICSMFAFVLRNETVSCCQSVSQVHVMPT